MNKENTLTHTLTIIQDELPYDAACKRLLSEKQILAHILKGCLKEYQDSTIDEIVNKYIEGTPEVSSVPLFPDEQGSMITGSNTEDKTIHEGTTLFDIRFKALAPSGNGYISLLINVEAQNKFHTTYPMMMRIIYYVARMISSQYGREFTDSHYEKIKKSCSIWIFPHPPKYMSNSITELYIAQRNKEGNVVPLLPHSDLFSAFLIGLGEDEDEYHGLLRFLDILFSSAMSAQRKREVLEKEYNIEVTSTMDREVTIMSSLSQGLIDQGIAQGIAQGLEQGIAQGIAQGLEQGIAQGLEQGISIGKEEQQLRSLHRAIKKLGFTLDQALDFEDIPQDQRQKYKDLLKEKENPL